MTIAANPSNDTRVGADGNKVVPAIATTVDRAGVRALFRNRRGLAALSWLPRCAWYGTMTAVADVHGTADGLLVLLAVPLDRRVRRWGTGGILKMKIGSLTALPTNPRFNLVAMGSAKRHWSVAPPLRRISGACRLRGGHCAYPRARHARAVKPAETSVA